MTIDEIIDKRNRIIQRVQREQQRNIMYRTLEESDYEEENQAKDLEILEFPHSDYSNEDSDDESSYQKFQTL